LYLEYFSFCYQKSSVFWQMFGFICKFGFFNWLKKPNLRQKTKAMPKKPNLRQKNRSYAKKNQSYAKKTELTKKPNINLSN